MQCNVSSFCRAIRLNANEENERYFVHELLSGSSLFKSRPKILSNPEFEEYLKKLRAKRAQKEYEKLINYNKRSEHEKSVLSMIRSEGSERWLDWTSIGHLLMIMVGSFLVFFYLAHHLWPHQREYKIVSGSIGLLFGLLVEFGLMVIREHRNEMEAHSKNPDINTSANHFRYNQVSLKSVADDARKRRKLKAHKVDEANES